MLVKAESKLVRQSPQKLRLVADEIRNLSVSQALALLPNLEKKAARPLYQVLRQAVGNAVNNFQLEEKDLKIKSLQVGEGPRYKRTDKAHRAFRWGTIKKRTSRIKLILEGEKEDISKTPKNRSSKKPPGRSIVKRRKEKNGSKS